MGIRGALGIVGIVTLALAGCGGPVGGVATATGTVSADRALVREYYERANTAAAEGSAAQDTFFDETQHPDFTDDRCPLEGLTVDFDPAFTTLRPQPGWEPVAGTGAPRGAIYVVAVTVTVNRDGVELGNQVGSQHIVVLDGSTYGFAPCLT